MNILRSLLALVLFFSSEAIISASSVTIKVLMEDAARAENTCWKLSCQHGFSLVDPHMSNHKMVTQEAEIAVRIHEQQVTLNGKKLKKHDLIIQPTQGHISFNGREYAGVFRCIVTDKRAYLVNMLPLEEYVCAVLKAESWPGWPLEVNKAFATIARSYAVHTAQQSVKMKLPYHIKKTKEHQTYFGVHDNEILIQAVEQTRGQLLTYQDEPILAMFDSCCGGVVPAHTKEQINFEKAPYLARKYRCDFCKKTRIYQWQKQFDLAQVEEIIKKHISLPGMLKDISVLKRDKAGLVTRVQLKTTKKTLTISGKQLYFASNDIKSFCFSLEKKGNKITFAGKGQGHHIGACQWGARAMVDLGWKYHEILYFYYPGTSLVTMQA